MEMIPVITAVPTHLSDTTLFWFIVHFRMAGLLLLRSSFVPDEYFQTLEPAFALVHGERAGIR